MRYLESGDCVYSLKDFPWQQILLSPTVRDRHKNEYYNIPCAFDIETTNIPAEKEITYTKTGRKLVNTVRKAYAYMYHWQLCIDTYVIFGRTWEEWILTMSKMVNYLELSKTHRIVIYVHNLPFEWQFIKDFIEVESMFARKQKKPIKVLETRGIEWRCSYSLSNMSLAKFCENTPGVTHGKIVGEYDYDTKRTPFTPLTDEEEEYCYNDVYGLCECIRYRLEEDNIVKIPLTSTGYVRREFRKVTNTSGNRWKWKKTKPDPLCYQMLKEAFAGGNTHANYLKVNRVIIGVESYDIGSSYPGVMIRKKFPGGFMQIRTEKLVEHYEKGDALLFRVRFTKLEYKLHGRIPYISLSKGRNKTGCVSDNGRCLYAETFEMTITDVDWQIITSMYRWEALEIGECYAAKYSYLPDEFRLLLHEYFRRKTMLKGTEHEYEYMKSKNRINSAYGMMVTDIVSPEITYVENEWHEEYPEIGDALDAYYNNRNSFLAYQWGVWVTAWARFELQKAIDICGQHILYVDTDSVKSTRSIREQIEMLNQEVMHEIKECGIDCVVHHNGRDYVMGMWEYEGTYDEFKTLGAKKYVYKQNGHYTTTVAGLSKKVGAEYINKYGIDYFAIGSVFEHCGNLEATYNEESPHYIDEGDGEFLTSSNLALVDTDYTLGVTNEYWALLKYF